MTIEELRDIAARSLTKIDGGDLLDQAYHKVIALAARIERSGR